MKQLRKNIWCLFKPLPNNKIWDLSKLEALADDKINVIEKLKIVIGRVKTMWEKEKMLVTSIFSFSHNVGKSLSPQGR